MPIEILSHKARSEQREPAAGFSATDGGEKSRARDHNISSDDTEIALAQNALFKFF